MDAQHKVYPGTLADHQIAERCSKDDMFPMLSPFVSEKVRFGALSYGLSHYGYDIRLGDIVIIPRRSKGIINPRKAEDLDKQVLETLTLGRKKGIPGETCCAMNPGDFILAGTLEYFRIPKDIVAVVHDKSTLARLGIAVQNTVLEPGWEGYLTLEITNHGTNDILLSAGMPIAQVIFHKGSEVPKVPYSGKYQGQERGATAKS